MKRYLVHSVVAVMLMMVGSAEAGVTTQSGTIKYLRFNNVGDSFGPPGDAIIAEVIVSLDNVFFYGLQLRQDTNQLAHQAMADQLREAFDHNWTVFLDVDLASGKHQGTLLRIATTKP